MKLALVIFVKTPKLSSIKTRLAKTTTTQFAEEFYIRSVRATASFAKSLATELPNLDLYWAVAEKEGVEADYWKNFSRIYQGEGDLGKRLFHVYSSLKGKYSGLYFMGADSPHLSALYLAGEIKKAMTNEDIQFLLGKTRDGGYYIFGGKECLPDDVWLNVEYSSTQTAENFLKNLSHHGRVHLINEDFDIDEKDDLQLYADKRFERQELEFEQIELIKWIKEKNEKLFF